MPQALKELREKQARLLADARARLDEITPETPEGRAKELEAQHDAAMSEYDRLEERGEKLEKLDAAERVAEERGRKVDGDRRPNKEDRSEREDAGADDEITYRSVFAKVVCGGLDDLTPEERAVLRGGVVRIDDKEQRAQTAGTTTAGGYTVPTEILGFIEKALKDWGPMYDGDIVTEIVTASGNALKIPTVDDTAKSAGAHTEAAALTDDGSEDVVFGQKSLDSFVFDTEFVRFSWELEKDSIFAMESLLGGLLGERLARVANAQLTTGSGASAPNGIVTASTAGKTAALTTAFTADEVIDFLHSIDPAYRRSPKFRFMFHDLVLAAIRKLKDGQGNYLWQMGDVTKGVPASLLGHPYSINQDMSSAFTTGQKLIVAGDFGRYYVRKVGMPLIGVLRERFWPDTGVAGLIRFDGELGTAAAVKHLKLA